MIIGVAGGSGSGKTTVVRAVTQLLGRNSVAVVQHDSYYVDRSHLPIAERGLINYDHPDSLETALLVCHLNELRAGGHVMVPVYDFTRHVRTADRVRVGPSEIVIVEGILLFADTHLRELFDVRIFVETDADIRILRRIVRDQGERNRSIESIVEQYLTTVRPMHLEFVEPTKVHADIVIRDEGRNEAAMKSLADHIHSLMEGQGH